MTHTVIGVFESAGAASAAEQALRAAGFPSTAIFDRESLAETSGNEGRGLMGFLRDLFRADDHPDARPYAQAIDQGNCIVSAEVGSADEALRATTILEDAGALDVDAQAGVGTRRTTTEAATGEASRVIPVVQEELKVGKRQVERGRVRVYTRTVELPVEQDVTLREETVVVERRPVSRTADVNERMPQERVFEVRTTGEEPVVERTARVVEEVEVAKVVQERTEKVRDRVRRTDVEVEDDSTDAKPPIGGGASSGQAGRP